MVTAIGKRQRTIRNYLPILESPKPNADSNIESPKPGAVSKTIEPSQPKKKFQKKSIDFEKTIVGATAKQGDDQNNESPKQDVDSTTIQLSLPQERFRKKLTDSANIGTVDKMTTASLPTSDHPVISHSQFGYLSYERLTFEPIDSVISKEVIKEFALPSGSDSEISIQKKVWAEVETEFAKTFEAIFEKESESQAARSTELATASRSEMSLKSSMSTNITASGGLPGIFNASSSFGLTFDKALSKSDERTTQYMQSITESAAARTSENHKVSFSTKSTTGIENTNTETYRNTNPNSWVKVVARKVMQRWKIRFERVDVQLAIDVMVRNPGKNLRSAFLSGVFDPSSISDPDPVNPPEGAPAPPEDPLPVTKTIRAPGSVSPTDHWRVFVMFEVPRYYTLHHIKASGTDNMAVGFALGDQSTGRDDDALGRVYADQLAIGTFPEHIGVWVYNSSPQNPQWTTEEIEVTAEFRATSQALSNWIEIAKPFAIRTAEREWEQRRAQRMATELIMDKESTVPPVQILRKYERDELFSAAMRFFKHQDNSPEPGPLEGISPGAIKEYFEALAWEDASTILYPYWWDKSAFSDITEIAKIVHKDFFRKEFLRSSWCRIVIPVRAGYEKWALTEFYGPELGALLDKVDAGEEIPNGSEFKSLAIGYLNITGKKWLNENTAEQTSQPQPENLAKTKVIASWEEDTPTDEVDFAITKLDFSDAHGWLKRLISWIWS